MKAGDKVWRSEYGRVDYVTVVSISSIGNEAAVQTPKHGMTVCNIASLHKSKALATAACSHERIKDLRKHYEAIERAHESFRSAAKSVLEALEATEVTP